MRQIFYAAALAFMASSAQASIEFATCENPAEQIVPADWQPYEADGPVVPVPPFIAEKSEQLDLISGGRLFVDSRGEIINLDAVDWTANDNSFYSTQLHGLVGLGTLLRDKEKLAEDVEAAIGQHILNWAHCSLYNREINPRAWFEGTVMKRQSNLLLALNYVRAHGELPGLDLNTLLYLIDAGASYLLDEPGVYKRGNHGIRQDMLLAATGALLPNHPRAEKMLRLAESRLDEAAEGQFSPSGIWLEHAPGYVDYMVRLMIDIAALSTASPAFNPVFAQNLEPSRDYLLAVLAPNGWLPPVGRAGGRKVRREVATRLYIQRHLKRSARSMRSFPDYGHAVIRGDHPDGLYLLFVAAQNLPAGKRHADELSFLLHNHGRVWVTEGGQQSTTPGRMTNYLRSPYAHNTYVLNGEFVDSHGEPDLLTKLTQAEKTEIGFIMSGFSERFPEAARFERTIEVDADFETVRIADRLGAKGDWQGFLQFPRDLRVNVEGDLVTVRDREAETEMVLHFRSDADLEFSTCRGERNPICGWGRSPRHGPVTRLGWSFSGPAEIEIGVSWR